MSKLQRSMLSIAVGLLTCAAIVTCGNPQSTQTHRMKASVPNLSAAAVFEVCNLTDAGGQVYNNGGAHDDAGYGLDAGRVQVCTGNPYLLLDGGSLASAPVQTSEITNVSFIFNVLTFNALNSIILPTMQGSNDGTHWVNVPSSLQYGAGATYNGDGGTNSYTLDVPVFDYAQAQVNVAIDGGSNGVLTGTWFLKGRSQ